MGPLPARALAYLSLRVGYRIERDRKRKQVVFEAIRFLAKPGRSASSAIIRRVQTLHAAWRETPILEEILDNEEGREFIKLLEAAASGEKAVHARLRAVAASLAPTVRVTPGPKVTAASAAHEWALAEWAELINRKAYTWDTETKDFTDDLTKATRIEFGNPDFDPRPARRRLRRVRTWKCRF